MGTFARNVATTDLITIQLDTTIEEAHSLMKEKRIRHLPVVDELDYIVGIVSQRDIQNVRLPQKLTVDLFMTSPVESVDQLTPLRAVILRMIERKISCMLVADENSNAFGIITTDDLLWHLAQMIKDDAEVKQPLISTLSLQAIGRITNTLSTAGI